MHASLRDRGVEVSKRPSFPMGPVCFFSDPDGNGRPVQEPSGRG